MLSVPLTVRWNRSHRIVSHAQCSQAHYSAVTTLLLDRGYKVRIATRSVAKQGPFKELLEKKHGADAVEFVEIADYDKEESWDKILKGMSS